MQIDESKLPPRPAGSNDANTDPDSPLARYGRARKETGLLLEPMPDGYWTPWHIANEKVRDLEEEAADIRRWYGSRLEILSAWAREHLEGKDLHTFFNIVANARPHVTDEPEWFRAVSAKLAAKRNAGVMEDGNG